MTTRHDTAASPVKGGAAPGRPPGGRAAAEADRKQRAKLSRRWQRDIRWSPYAFVSPFFLLFVAFGLFPLIYTGWASLHTVELTAPTDMKWTGLDNYTRIFDDDFFWNAAKNTLFIGIISTVPQLLMAMGLAHILNYKLRASTFYRVVMLAPYATSIAAASLVFVLLFGRDYGMINWFLDLVGLDKIDWQNGSWASKFAVSSIVIWRWTGYNALIYLAAMQAIPQDLYESAALDGASRWRQFIHVTLPSLRPTILFTVVVSTIGASQVFGEPLLFDANKGASGGSQHQFQTLGLYLYEQGWVNQHLGRASAIAWAMFLILIVIGILNAVISRRLRASS
ncbi:carbohydrate ABC transporter permease [Streptomyces coelicoflavus]|uniref:carbohydrate ABC transporter permease n=1 Tax=Streptomyces TaxID=1883 RepID=UPI0012917493|nr:MULTISPECIES: sugar ABC transporter permease [Streptomyces]KAF2779933.1 cellobiose ABC transporter permease [Streptomyces sp. OM5714]MCX5037665.1 sugar ABC transporter permease [Streptomyces coelicoflavus]MDI6517477.1 sugar ABC transporter permease [Streptomyces coelicoflavus]NHI09477.1 cellobiose ABC transporter permease [Streptomyces sp. KO7888]QFX86376.1 ABC transporter permease subunit [Streptomyces sp. SYP-A7193]